MAEISESKTELYINIDAEPAVKALKSITRAAREASQALRELENDAGARLTEEVVSRLRDTLAQCSPCIIVAGEAEAQPLYKPLSAYTTVELHEELIKRQGVEEFILGPGDVCDLVWNKGCGNEISGPARIIINQD